MRRIAVLAAVFVADILSWCPGACALEAAVNANSYAHSSRRMRDGFPRVPIVSMAQTADGYLWLGSQMGLFRFDGVRGDAWHELTGQELPSNWTNSLLAARDGALWIGTTGGLVRWSHGRLTGYPELTGLDVGWLLEDHEGTIWAAAESEATATGRLCAIRSGSVHCSGEDGSLGTRVYDVHEDRGGRLWVAASNGLWRWSPGPPLLYPLLDPNDSYWQSLAENPAGALVVSTRRGIRLIENDAVRDYALPVVLSRAEPACVLVDRRGALWIGTRGQGLLRVQRGQRHPDVYDSASGLSGDHVLKLFEDHEGDIWVATENGLDQFHEVAARTISVDQGLPRGELNSIVASSDGSVWIATPSGLFRWKSGEMTVYRGHRDQHDRGSSPALRPATVREILVRGLPEGTSGALYEDRRGRLWLGSSSGLGYIEGDRFISVPGLSSESGGLIHSIVEDIAGNFWISQGSAGLIRLSPDGHSEPLGFGQLGIGEIWHIAPDPRGRGLWLGSVQGTIARFEDGQVRSSHTAGSGSGKKAVNELRVSADGTAWASTEAGLAIVRGGHVVMLNSASGLPCDDVHAMIEDNDDSYWLYTGCGLVQIRRSELEAWAASVASDTAASWRPRLTVLDTSDAVRSFTSRGSLSPKVAKTQDGRLWFATPDGLMVLDPRALPHNALPPPVHIERVVADRKSYDPSLDLHLPAAVRDLQIDYTALSLIAPEKVLFRYRLEGRDRDWQEVGSRRQAFYSDLQPGIYNFRVIASNNSGVWNEQGAALDFSIVPAYWQTNWFQTLCLAAFAALLWLLYRLRLRQVARRFELTLDARVAERTRIARDLHDTLLQSFNGLLFRLQAAADLVRARPTEAHQMLESSIAQAAQAIQDGRRAVQGLRASTEEDNDLALAVRSLGEELSAERPSAPAIAFRIDVEGDPRPLHPILRDEIYRIAREALRNAFQHSLGTQIEAELCYDARQFRLRIRDDGRGIDAGILVHGRQGHFGLHGMHERAGQLGGKLTIWSAQGGGTEVELTVPGSLAYAVARSSRSQRVAQDDTESSPE